MAKGKYARKRLLKQLREVSVHDSGLSAYTVKALETAGIKTLADLHLKNDDEIKAIHGIGDKAMKEIQTLKARMVENKCQQ